MCKSDLLSRDVLTVVVVVIVFHIGFYLNVVEFCIRDTSPFPSGISGIWGEGRHSSFNSRGSKWRGRGCNIHGKRVIAVEEDVWNVD